MNTFFRWLFVTGIIARIINNSFIQFLLPSVSGAYFLVLDVWGSDLQIITEYKYIHKVIFAILLLLTLFIQIFKEITISVFSSSNKSYLGFLEEFVIFTASAVDLKLRRFRNCAKNLKPQGDTFKVITQPKEQIEYLIYQAIKWIRVLFSLSEDEISITVICINNVYSKYVFNSPKNWNRTEANKIIQGPSAASYCLKTGEPIFLANKMQTQTSISYYISNRDKRMNDGSMYCYPVFVNLSNNEYKFIITITTYNKRLCSSDDNESSKIVISILREVCRRIELELTLLAIRMWQYNE